MSMYLKTSTVVRAEPVNAFDFLMRNPKGKIYSSRGPEVGDIGRTASYEPGYKVTDRAGHVFWVEKSEFELGYRLVPDDYGKYERPIDLKIVDELITAGLRALARKAHPDIVGGDADRMSSINAAGRWLREKIVEEA